MAIDTPYSFEITCSGALHRLTFNITSDALCCCDVTEESLVGPTPLSTVYDDPRAHYYSNDELLCVCIERYRYVTVVAVVTYFQRLFLFFFVTRLVSICYIHECQMSKTFIGGTVS